MSDLVSRLWAWERVFPCDEDKPEGSLYLEAAARIEELEDEIKEIKKMDKWDLSKLEKVANEEARHGNREALEEMTKKLENLKQFLKLSKTKIYEQEASWFEYEGTTEAVLMAGLSSEVGEVQAEWLKEQRLDRSDTDRTEELLNELSDVLWYVSRIAARRGTDLHALMRRNIIKLEERNWYGYK